MNDRLRVSTVSWKFQTYLQFCSNLLVKFPIFLKSGLLFKFLLSFQFINKTLRLNNLKSRAAMNAEISVFVICVEVIIYLLLHKLHDFTFKADPTKSCLQADRSVYDIRLNNVEFQL